MVTDRTLKLYHVSPAENASSILKSGLLPERAYGPPFVYLVPHGLLKWACRHVQNKHCCRSVVIFEVTIRRRSVRRWANLTAYKYGRAGHIWRTPGWIKPERLLLLGFASGVNERREKH